MKKIHFLAVLVLALQAIASAQASYIITTSGLTFTPSTINANVGDTIIYNVDFSMHPLQQVSSATWAADQSTPLAGGFSNTTGTTYKVILTQPDTIYYVCRMHISYGMKGRIFVSPTTGIDNISSISSAPFPNPADQQLSITPISIDNFSFTLTDMKGQVIMVGAKYAGPQNPITMDVSAIADGSYMFALTNSKSVMRESKIEIKHK